ncbi:transposase [Streptosporangium sp. NBC_01469]|uniref:transposase n=1 Tax=Streptosporangium sp. NBC_01469 TaxID=2903898 RepID=UPI003FCE2C8F
MVPARGHPDRASTRPLPAPIIGSRLSLLQTRTAIPPDLPALSRRPPRRAKELRLDRLTRPDPGRPPSTRRPDHAGLGQPQHPPDRRDAPLHRRAGLAHRLPTLPTYAPDLNPVEGVWSVLRRTTQANRAFTDPHDLITAIRQGLRRLQHRHDILDGCLIGTGLVPAPP